MQGNNFTTEGSWATVGKAALKVLLGCYVLMLADAAAVDCCNIGEELSLLLCLLLTSSRAPALFNALVSVRKARVSTCMCGANVPAILNIVFLARLIGTDLMS
jgi:hypothetical protein